MAKTFIHTAASPTSNVRMQPHIAIELKALLEIRAQVPLADFSSVSPDFHFGRRIAGMTCTIQFL